MRPSVVIALMLALVFGGASAQGPAPGTLSASEASMHGYGDANKACPEWTDGCRTCRRSNGGGPVCSNIGIACQPVAITCGGRAEPVK